MSAKAGFSLIEALVALIVAAVSLLAIFELQRQMTRAQARYERAFEDSRRQRNALAMLEHLNPAERPQGVLAEGGGRQMRWTSTPLTPFRPVQGRGSRHEVRLYRLHVRLLAADGGVATTFELDRVGWRPRSGLDLSATSTDRSRRPSP